MLNLPWIIFQDSVPWYFATIKIILPGTVYRKLHKAINIVGRLCPQRDEPFAKYIEHGIPIHPLALLFRTCGSHERRQPIQKGPLALLYLESAGNVIALAGLQSVVPSRPVRGREGQEEGVDRLGTEARDSNKSAVLGGQGHVRR